MIQTTRTLVEAAGAAPLAAALRLSEQLTGKRVALILSGGNVTPEQLLDVLAVAQSGYSSFRQARGSAGWVFGVRSSRKL
jgi:threonine dehydratase